MPRKPAPAQVVEDIDDLLITADLVRGFGVTKITIEKWRKGWGLPFVRIRGKAQPSIRFRKDAVEAWAKHNERLFDLKRRPKRRPHKS